MRFLGDTRNAPGPSLQVYELVELAEFNPESIPYLLMAAIYNGFGYEALSVPYINMSDNMSDQKLQAAAIAGTISRRRCRRPIIADWAFGKCTAMHLRVRIHNT
jgi:hypothetical protein